jgi:voltage-gated potassium channel Kch
MAIQIRIVSNFWKADWHLSFLLGLLLLIVFVLYPMGNHGPLVGIILQLFFSLVLMTGVAMVASSRLALALAALFAAGTAAIGWIRLYAPGWPLVLPGVTLWILFFAVLAAVILAHVFGQGKINFHRIQGAIAVYLLLGVIWSGGYRLVIYFDPEAFTSLLISDESMLMSKLVYFSFVTLTTVGYGDIIAVHPAARSLAILEALTGQLFPAVLIARLVSMEVSHRNAS